MPWRGAKTLAGCPNVKVPSFFCSIQNRSDEISKSPILRMVSKQCNSSWEGDKPKIGNMGVEPKIGVPPNHPF